MSPDRNTRDGINTTHGDRRYQALVEATSQAVWSWRSDGNHNSGDFELARAWWQQVTGQTLEEQHSREDAWLDVVHPEDRDRASKAWTVAISESRTYDVEYRVRDKRGSWRYVRARGVPVHEANGDIHEWVGTLDDITDQKELELERERSRVQAEAERARLDTVFRHAPSFMAVLRGPDHVFELANDRYLQLIGGRDVIGLPVRIALPEIEGQGYFELLDKVYSTGQSHAVNDATIKILGPKGLMERTVEFIYQPLHDASGGISGVIVQGIDLTDRRDAQQRLHALQTSSERQQRMFETALSNTADFVYLFDTDGRFTFVNKALLDLWEKNLDEAVGKNFFELGYPSELAARLQHQIQTVIDTRQPLRDSTPYTSSKSTRFYEYIFVPILGTDGHVEAVAGSTRDITDRLQGEESLREADRRKNEFIAALAHELRNPLAPIRNALQMLRMAPDRADLMRECNDIMERQLNHIVRLVDDLSDASRISQKKMVLRKTRFDLGVVIRTAVEAAEPLIKESRHELSVLLPEQRLTLNGDLTRLAQVFSNLLTNSAKYTPPGGRIWLSVRPHGREVVVEVRDTGLGIPTAALPTIFNMFSQVDRTIERSSGGLGIGLALVRGFVEMHDGRVEVKSVEGQGTTFTVRLPLGNADLVQIEESSNRLDSNVAGKRILVVDDNVDGAKSMAAMLRLLGNEVNVANDGLEALSVAKDFGPDLILMDVGMPRMSGLESARRIRAETWGTTVKIYALTGWGQEIDREQSIAAGCDGHLVKPIYLNDLQKLLAD